MTIHFKLTKRKIEVMKFKANGYADKEVADKMNLSYATIKSHINQSLQISECRNCVELIYKLTKAQII